MMANDVKKAIDELMENLDTIGMFMLAEVRHFLRTSGDVSKEEFMQEVNKISKSMEQSGKMATEDVARAAERIKGAWSELEQERREDWEQFRDELETKLSSMENLSKETYELCVNQVKESLERQWTAMGRVGEDQVNTVRNYSEDLASQFKDQWTTFKNTFDETGNRVDRALRAAWSELNKKKK
jgi:ElaB/YqjD/DUF883 family membrane-anchored ribosome-binding protein